MPNHVHGIILLPEDGTVSLGSVVRSYKAATTRTVRQSLLLAFAWQANYYEHIIRTPHAWNHIREYITTNPRRWELDQENPDSTP
ncbi:MAG TPA: transposase [Chloroflexota bacterium]|nr:transposase [Chloroflexota bacterium]